MKHIKVIGHFLIVLCMTNIVLQILLHKEMSKEKPVQTMKIPALDSLAEDSKSRESMIMQVILLGQHKGGLHENESIDLCPACVASPRSLKVTDL
jgi:hypothetical protein